jgi:small GTP-binding protein
LPERPATPSIRGSIYEGIPVTLIDTAGIRRRGRIDPGVERYSVVRSFKAIERADVALLMIDAETGITAQDAHIAGYILEAWKSCVVLVNKWDAIEKDSYTMDAYTNQIRQQLNFMDYVPLLFISAKTGQRVDQVLPLALQVQEERLARLTTSKLNNILQKAQDVHPAPSQAGTAAQNLLRHPGALRPADFPAFRQRPIADALFLCPFSRKPHSGGIRFPGYANPRDCQIPPRRRLARIKKDTAYISRVLFDSRFLIHCPKPAAPFSPLGQFDDRHD